MTWERFGYICRKVSAGIGEHETVSDCIARVEKEQSSALYGKPIGSSSIQRKILEQIGSFENKDKALSALNLYQGLKLSENFEEPMRFKRVVAYLSYVTFIFYIVVGIYQLKVAPTFLGALEDLNLSMPSYLGWYQDYWWYFVLAVTILLISSLLIGHNLRKIFRFVLGIENSVVLKYLAFKGIRQSYIKVIDILQFPIELSSDKNSKTPSKLVEHLHDVQVSNMSVAVEMQELLRIEMRLLLERCEQQMKYISMLVAFVVVWAIFFFLASAYSPIFVLGEVI
ncbi:hypothetical protein [Arsukibacterium sp.]|uniref:hypothetical protein n=1 Tax=Arsukibacterium sp. TaxID=1977258 RepID=UPI002FD88F2C